MDEGKSETPDVSEKNNVLVPGSHEVVVESTSVETVKTEKDQYGPEAIREDIKFKAEKIRSWAQKVGLSEGKDFKIIESIADIETDTESVAPHEFKQFFVAIHEDHYQKFKEYILGQYSEERKKENPNNKYGGPKLDYSWGGRFAVGWDGVPFDTVAVSSLENVAAPTHQEEFKKFFKQKTGFDFPTSEVLNPLLKEMSEKGLDKYKIGT